MSEHAGNHHISLIIKSTAGVWPDARFNIENRAQKVLDEGVHHFHLDPSPAQPYLLVREADGSTLNLSEKLEQLGLHDGEGVLIQAGQPVDG
ncbi:MAG TPA: hypothetical protein VFH80_14925 [Solirubrobacteraceae bacterium]|nr:hypothetical protein [Solirubrobacteraceae bacterium]